MIQIRKRKRERVRTPRRKTHLVKKTERERAEEKMNRRTGAGESGVQRTNEDRETEGR